MKPFASVVYLVDSSPEIGDFQIPMTVLPAGFMDYQNRKISNCVGKHRSTSGHQRTVFHGKSDFRQNLRKNGLLLQTPKLPDGIYRDS